MLSSDEETDSDAPVFNRKQHIENQLLCPKGLEEKFGEADLQQKVEQFIERYPMSAAFIKKEKGKLPYSVFKPSSNSLFFIKSVFDKRPPTAFFPYPKYTKAKRDCERIRRYKREDVEYLYMAFKISDSTHIYNAVVNTFKNGGFDMLEDTDRFNCIWNGYTKPEEIAPLNKY